MYILQFIWVIDKDKKKRKKKTDFHQHVFKNIDIWHEHDK
jgi:hypothetical protein